MKKILCIYVAILLLAMPGVVAQVDGGLTRSGEVSTYDGTRADFLTVAGKLSRYPQLAKSGEELHYAPVVTTDSMNVDLSNAVNVFGNILFNGWYETVTAQGFQLSISSSFESSTVTEYPVMPASPYTECDQPCLANVFSMTITDLTPDILYYVRAYATNADGITYGEALPVIIYGGGSGTTATLPTVTTGSVSDVTATSAMCGGEVTADGGAEVTARGVCWGTSETPTVADAHTSDGTGIGTFTSSINGLAEGTAYYVRAYATNSEGTAYGDQLTFVTSSGTTPNPVEGDAIPCPNTPTVTDHEGNVYATVQIGDQCWMRDNLRTTTSPSTGTYLIPAANANYTYTGKQAFWYNNDSATYAPMNYGLLYNWNAAVDTFNTAYGETSVNTSSSNAVSVTFSGHRRGICPAGWHLPSDAEWTTLTDYLNSHEEYRSGGFDGYVAKALASTNGWSGSSTTYAVGNNPSGNNATGFSAVPAGRCNGSSFAYAGYYARFWSSTQDGSYYAYCRTLRHYYANVSRGHNVENYGYSVRCLRDNDVPPTSQTQPTVTTSAATNITSTSAMLNGNVSNPDNVAITAQGFEWKATAGGAYVAVNATGETMTYNLTGLTAGTSYTYRAFVTTAEGTSYGEAVSFTTLAAGGGAVEGDAIPCPNTPTVTDHEGNVYATVQIGNQCWMRDNLRTTTSPSTGTYLIPAANANYTYTGKQAFWYNNDSATYAPMNYGLLYNWNAAVDTFNTAYGETSVNNSSDNAVSVTFSGHRRGICPAGWHLPSDAEWTQLTNYVSSQSEYQCGGNSSYIAKALASTEGWNSYGGECYPGDQSVTANNATGFSAVPAGDCGGSSFNYAGDGASFWSSTQDDSVSFWSPPQDDGGYAYDRFLDSGGADVGSESSGKANGYSVRCLRDNDVPPTSQTQPTVTTSAATNITSTSATLNGSISNPDEVAITTQGFEWKATAGGAYAAVNATGETMTYNLTGLTAGTSYTYRAFVTTAEGTSYGEAVSFTTLAAGGGAVEGDAIPCPGTPTVTDHEGNVYNTVQIGTQCWTKENLRTTTSPSTGTYLIPAANANNTFTGKQARWYDNDSATYAPMNYGLLYNWNAAVDTFNIAYGETSVQPATGYYAVTFTGHRRGICPAGWHLPSDAEWTQLTDYVSSQSEYQCGGNSSCIAKALASETDVWSSSAGECYPGNQSVNRNNATGFSAVPAGRCDGSSFSYAGSYANFWSSTQDDSSFAYLRGLDNNLAGVYRHDNTKRRGFSVRCLRD